MERIKEGRKEGREKGRKEKGRKNTVSIINKKEKVKFAI